MRTGESAVGAAASLSKHRQSGPCDQNRDRNQTLHAAILRLFRLSSAESEDSLDGTPF